MDKRNARWMRAVLLSLAALLALCAAAVCLADPYQVYRLARWFTPAYESGEQAYFNAGLARHSDYDAAIIGTSMVENTRVSQVDARFGTRSIKLPFEGGMANNHAEALRVAFATRELTHVLYGMDMYSFVRDPAYSSFDMPRYLYDGNPFTDISYLLNGDVLFHRIPSALYRKWRGEEPEPVSADMRYAWGWNDSAHYGEESVLNTYDFSKPAKPMLEPDAFAANVRANFDKYVRPFLEDHPDTAFLFFFPPYSSLQWYMMQQDGHLDAVLHTKVQLAELLMPHPNARLHDFSAHLDWIENFDLYADYSHYHPNVNAWMVDAMANGDFLVTDLSAVQASTEVLARVAQNFPVPDR